MGSVYLVGSKPGWIRRMVLPADQAGHGLAGGPRSVRVRAAGTGAHGSSQYRQGARRRLDRGRPAVLRHGAGQGRPDHRVLRHAPAGPAGTAGAGSPDLLGRAARSSKRNHPPRSEAVEYPGRKPRRQAGAQGDRLRSGQGDKRPSVDRAEHVHGIRISGRHAALHARPNRPDSMQSTSTPGRTSIRWA